MKECEPLGSVVDEFDHVLEELWRVDDDRLVARNVFGDVGEDAVQETEPVEILKRSTGALACCSFTNA